MGTDSQSDHSAASNSKKGLIYDSLTALFMLIAVIGIAFWVVRDMADGPVTLYHVFIAASITAVATGFGALPFLFVENFENKWLGVGNAIAAGLMLGASIGLVFEGFALEAVSGKFVKMASGIIVGGVLVIFSRRFLDSREGDYSIGNIEGANAIKMLMIVGIMTVHSFAEGIGVGVSFGDSPTFGAFISMAIAVHNIPEGLAISLILIPRGTSVRKAGWWSIFSSLPQPLMAVPAFLFVLTFKEFLPVGLGIAAGAMFWMVFKELIPEAVEEISSRSVWLITLATTVAMLVFQFIID